MRSTWRIAMVGLIPLFSLTAVGGECPDIDGLRTSLQKHNYIAVDFLQMTYSDIFETVDTLPGSLRAGGRGRFRLELPQQTIVSNGLLYWSYSPENRQVLVDSVAKLGSWDPLTLLYDPEGVYFCTAQEKSPGWLEFEMAAHDSLTEPQTFTLRVANKSYTPLRLVYYDDNGSRIEVRLERFTRQESLPDSLFEFRPGPDVEVILIP